MGQSWSAIVMDTSPKTLASGIRAGAAAFAIVFATGFALGTVRTIWIAPRLGDAIAVLIELPFMLIVSWLTAGWAIRRWQVSSHVGHIGAAITGFGLLMAAELVLAIVAFGQSAMGWASALAKSPGLYGFAAQMLFGLMLLTRRHNL
jgi:hypothetical protein